MSLMVRKLYNHHRNISVHRSNLLRPFFFYFLFYRFFLQRVRVGVRNKKINKIHSDYFPIGLKSKETRNRVSFDFNSIGNWSKGILFLFYELKWQYLTGGNLINLGIQDLDVVLRTGRMRWFGHVERSTGWISEVRKLNVVAQKRSGRPRKSWDEVIKNDRKKLDMDSADPQNRSEWRGRLRGRLVKKPNPR